LLVGLFVCYLFPFFPPFFPACLFCLFCLFVIIYSLFSHPFSPLHIYLMWQFGRGYIQRFVRLENSYQQTGIGDEIQGFFKDGLPMQAGQEGMECRSLVEGYYVGDLVKANPVREWNIEIQ
jgi:hypothetical protein